MLVIDGDEPYIPNWEIGFLMSARALCPWGEEWRLLDFEEENEATQC